MATDEQLNDRLYLNHIIKCNDRYSDAEVVYLGSKQHKLLLNSITPDGLICGLVVIKVCRANYLGFGEFLP